MIVHRSDQTLAIRALKSAAPYIRLYKGKTFVVKAGGGVFAEVATTRALVEQGYKRVLLVAGEAYPKNGFQYVLDSIATIYATKAGNGEIRRVHANVAPPTVEQFYALHKHFPRTDDERASFKQSLP